MIKTLSIWSTLFSLLLLACSSGPASEEGGRQELKIETASLELQASELDTATFAGGCFWCTEAYFERVKGVKAVVSGYSGGTTPNPTYKQVSYGQTDYAEAVQVYYDPEVVDYATLLKVFFATIDPTQVNRQGPDVGEQYRSVVFYDGKKEKKLATEYVEKLSVSGKYRKPIATKVQPLTNFYVAEDYHQDYYELNPNDPYVVSVARPKVKKFVKEYPELLKEKYKK
ncbi:peptide-methionine (S)-S-oxide reductase MsrA [Nafulsella turpanensis]|uniref:peptide-methionine (S)-S-oxide reductase MsrA n=1 Tax=Nafulsella turpanensis TaxID=1265690 RepID=UPI000687DD13|nr:peptide-methionine (S)-S-oxide reductase MsrA [Nafulsella turpanensis]